MVPPDSHQPSAVTMAIPTTVGTNTLVTWSTRRCTGGLAACAPSTSAIIRSSVDSLPTVVVSMRNRPSPFTLPPVTRSPGSLTTGMLSPVSSDSSTALSPDRIAPSTGIRSPGRTTTTSPVTTDVAGMVTTAPSRSTCAWSGRNCMSWRIAAEVPRRARASSHLPSLISVIMAADASK
jgi:hypothetical protein